MPGVCVRGQYWRAKSVEISLYKQFFAAWPAKHFSPCFSVCLLDLMLSHPHSDLLFDSDCRRKLDFSSEPVRAHWALLWSGTSYRQVLHIGMTERKSRIDECVNAARHH